MGNQYGPYVMYFLSKLMQQRNAEEMMSGIRANTKRFETIGATAASEATRATPTAPEAMPSPITAEAAQESRKSDELRELFAYDETGSRWHREKKLELLREFCPEGFASAERYGHFIIGQKEKKEYTGRDTTGAETSREAAETTKVCAGKCFIGIPGRFLKSEQPAGGSTGFTLWQPIRGAEEFFKSLEELDDELAESIYGYWIAALDENTLQISEA